MGSGERRRRDDHPCLADSVLVSSTCKTADSSPGNVTISSKSFDSSRDKQKTQTDSHAPGGVPLIRKNLQTQGISGKSEDIIMASWRTTTKKQYSGYIQRFDQYCDKRGVNPIHADVKTVIGFLTELFKSGLGYSGINRARSALSSVILQDKFTIGSHPLVCRFLKGVAELRPTILRYSQTWDVNLVLKYLSQIGDNEQLSLDLLSKKISILLLILSGQRVQTVKLMNLSQITFQKDDCDCEIRIVGNDSEKLKHFNSTKNVQVLKFHVFEDTKLCLVRCLKEYIKRTRDHRMSDKLILCYKKPFQPASKDTIGRWIKEVMNNSGIDVNIFKAHSIRGASTSAAKRADVPLDTILGSAGWTNAQTFKKFYCREINGEKDKDKTKKNFDQSILKYFAESDKKAN